MAGLTCSQSLFSIYTGLDACALAINGSNFTSSRAQWVLNSWKWLAAMNKFNYRLEALNVAKDIEHIPKHPWAPMEHPGNVETKIMTLIIINLPFGSDHPVVSRHILTPGSDG